MFKNEASWTFIRLLGFICTVVAPAADRRPLGETSFVSRVLQLLERFNTREFMIHPIHQSGCFPGGVITGLRTSYRYLTSPIKEGRGGATGGRSDVIKQTLLSLQRSSGGGCQIRGGGLIQDTSSGGDTSHQAEDDFTAQRRLTCKNRGLLLFFFFLRRFIFCFSLSKKCQNSQHVALWLDLHGAQINT